MTAFWSSAFIAGGYRQGKELALWRYRSACFLLTSIQIGAAARHSGKGDLIERGSHSKHNHTHLQMVLMVFDTQFIS
jgi:hypothetical protein